jgi:hypothetical protein
MKLEIVFCNRCCVSHPPGEHVARPRGSRPSLVPPPPDDWEGKVKPETELTKSLKRCSGWGGLSKVSKPKPKKPAVADVKVIKAQPREARRQAALAAVKASAKHAPDFAATDPSTTPSLPTPARKQTAEYRKKRKLHMRQKRAAAAEGITLEAYRDKYGAGFIPKTSRDNPKRKRAKAAKK